MKKYGLIGYPLTHSFSKRYFTEKFETEKIDSAYENFEIDNISKFTEIIINNPELVGLNVTIPYKEQVIPFLDELNESAREIGAVNTVKISLQQEKPVLSGYNTDVYGFRESLKPLLQSHVQQALVLGSGGASLAVCYALTELGIRYQLAGREPNEKKLSYDQLTAEMLKEYPLIINTSPLGTYPDVDRIPPIPLGGIGPGHICYDLVYNPPLTRFLAEAASRGAVTKNGYEMLVLQAEKAWEIWNQ